MSERMKMMVGKLYDLMARGCIEGEWNESFIESVNIRIKAGLPLSDKQIAKVEELFDKY